MDLAHSPALSVGAQVELALRLIAGLALGAIIGFERELHRQPAGFRTHSLVSLGAALFAIISGYGYGSAAIDPTRITAQIVSGIGFIGGGQVDTVPPARQARRSGRWRPLGRRPELASTCSPCWGRS